VEHRAGYAFDPDLATRLTDNKRLHQGDVKMVTIFEDMRRADADWYTAGPLETLSEAQLAALATESGMSVEELRRHLATPHIEMSCPLCGRPSTHLIGCKGCGGDAWAGEFDMLYGEDARKRLRRHVRKFLDGADGVTSEQVEHAVRHAYDWGGCSICATCWQHTLPSDACQICPLKLAADRQLASAAFQKLPHALILIFAGSGSPQERRQAVGRWLDRAWQHWTEHWNTLPEGQERVQVKAWRAALLHAAFRDDPIEVETGGAVGCTCGHAEEDHEGGYGRCTIEGCPCTSYEPDEGPDWVLDEDEGLYE
jgi:hypothetical protein